jgi:hypothetical protein
MRDIGRYSRASVSAKPLDVARQSSPSLFQCLLILYTFGPEGTWIKGLISERRMG